MSTRIDIEVAQALLSQRAKEIAGLNREQRLDRERKVKEEAAIKAAVDKGAEAALRNGRQGTGQAIGGGGAASLDARVQRLGLRSGVPEYYTPPQVAAQARRGKGWLLAPSSSQFKAIVGGPPSFAFANKPSGGGTHSMQFASGEGPLGANALYSSSEWIASTPQPSPLNGYQAYYSADTGRTSEPSSKEFTLELMAKVGAPAGTAGVEREYSDAVLSYPFGQIVINIGLSTVFWIPAGNRIFWGYAEVIYKGTSMFFHESTSTTYQGDPDYPELLDYNAWHHLAVVQSPGSSDATRVLSFYRDGIRYNQIETSSLLNWNLGSGGGIENAEVGMVHGNFASGYPVGVDPTALHGIRFTPRALYTGPTYTPPASITRLA